MEDGRSRTLKTLAPRGHLGLGLLIAMLAWLPPRTAVAVTLTQSDVTLALYDSSDGTSWNSLTTLTGLFGPHRCLCPDTLSVQLQLTSSGQTDLGNSTVAVNFLLGENCMSTPASCVSLGQVSFSSAQTAASPTFSSSLVFQSAADGATVNCASLTAGSTTLWALLTQDGTALSFAPTMDLPVTSATVEAPTAVTALPGNQDLLVTWVPPSDTSLVAGYQVLCLPGLASPATTGYESCGLASSSTVANPSPADTTQVCSADLPATTTSVRLSGFVNGTPYAVAVIAIDPSGGVSALSPVAQATPAPTLGFLDIYKQDGGAATGCSLSPSSRSHRASLILVVLAFSLPLAPVNRVRRALGRKRGLGPLVAVTVLALSSTSHAQEFAVDRSDDWDTQSVAPRMFLPPDWGLEVGLSYYRPAIDSEFGNGPHPYADTFGSSRHVLWEMELARYLRHGFGTWGAGLRVGYYKVTSAAFLEDGVTRSGDETGLRLIPFSLSAIYRADGLPGLKLVPLIPYAKAGLDGVFWTATNTGGSASETGFSPGWHAAAGIMLGLNSLGSGAIIPGALADPCAIFFEWDYAAINGLGLATSLHVGDNIWYAGFMFDL